MKKRFSLLCLLLACALLFSSCAGCARESYKPNDKSPTENSGTSGNTQGGSGSEGNSGTSGNTQGSSGSEGNSGTSGNTQGSSGSEGNSGTSNNNQSGSEPEQEPLDNEYLISNFTVDKQAMTVSAQLTSPQDATLLVRFIAEDVYFESNNTTAYLENGELCATLQVTGMAEPQNVTATIQGGTLPAQFVSEAALIGEDGKTLRSHVSIVHTQRFESFSNKTADDFKGEEKLLVFDNSPDSNFGVLADDVKMLSAQEIVEVSSNNQSISKYRISNPSAEIHTGDKIYVTAHNGEENVLVKVKHVSKDGDFTVITAENNTNATSAFEMKDFYKFLKVDASFDGNLTSEESTYAPLRYEKTANDNVDNGEISIPLGTITYESEGLEISCKPTGKIKASCNFIWDPELFGENYFQCEMTFRTQTLLEFEIESTFLGMEAEVGAFGDFEIATIRLPFGVTGLAAKAEISVYIDGLFRAMMSAEYSFESTSGFRYSTTEGYKITQKECKTDFKVIDLVGGATFRIGPDIEIGLTFLKDLISVTLDAYFGADINCGASGNGPDDRDDYYHGCYNSGWVRVLLNASCEFLVGIQITKKIQWSLVQLPVFDIEKPLVNSPFCIRDYGGRRVWGSCGNYVFRTPDLCAWEECLASLDTNNDGRVDVYQTLRLVKVFVKNTKTGKEFDVKLGDELYLPEGEYKAYAIYRNASYEKTFSSHTLIVGDVYWDEISKNYGIRSVLGDSHHCLFDDSDPSDRHINRNWDINDLVVSEGWI